HVRLQDDAALRLRLGGDHAARLPARSWHQPARLSRAVLINCCREQRTTWRGERRWSSFASGSSRGGRVMNAVPNWRLAGDWFDICSCDIPCPCEFAQPPTGNHCQGVLAWHVRE